MEGDIDRKKEERGLKNINKHNNLFLPLVLLWPTKFVFLCFHIRETRLDVSSSLIMAVDSLKHHKMVRFRQEAIMSLTICSSHLIR